MTESREQLGFMALLEAGAMELRKNGSYSVELSSSQLELVMRQVVAQSEAAMKKRDITARIDVLGVRISQGTNGSGRGEVHTVVTASKKIFFANPSVTITADFVLENSQQQPGLLNTSRLSVLPESLFGVVNPREYLAPYVEGTRINTTFQNVLTQEMAKRGATVQGMQLSFTERDTLRVDLQGGKR